MSDVLGSVAGLSLRPARPAPPVRVEAVHALAGRGLEDDVHADPLSPRQVLLAGAGVYAECALPAHALHENLLVDLDTSRLASGTILQVGEDVRLRLMFQCEACGQLDAGRPGLSRQLAGRRGMLARVVTGGTIRPGDRIRDLGLLAPDWPDDWRARVVRILDALPPRHVVDYGMLARLAGIQTSYCRALPGLLARLGPGYAGRAVAMRAATPFTRWDGAGLFDDAKI